jgi:hypothetical protein
VVMKGAGEVMKDDYVAMTADALVTGAAFEDRGDGSHGDLETVARDDSMTTKRSIVEDTGHIGHEHRAGPWALVEGKGSAVEVGPGDNNHDDDLEEGTGEGTVVVVEVRVGHTDGDAWVGEDRGSHTLVVAPASLIPSSDEGGTATRGAQGC